MKVWILSLGLLLVTAVRGGALREKRQANGDQANQAPNGNAQAPGNAAPGPVDQPTAQAPEDAPPTTPAPVEAEVAGTGDAADGLCQDGGRAKFKIFCYFKEIGSKPEKRIDLSDVKLSGNKKRPSERVLKFLNEHKDAIHDMIKDGKRVKISDIIRLEEHGAQMAKVVDENGEESNIELNPLQQPKLDELPPRPW